MKKGLFILFFALAALSSSYAQQPICGNAQDQIDLIPRLEQNKLVMEAMRAAAKDRGDVQYVPIHFHLVGDASGNGRHKESKVIDQLCKLNAAYLPVGIQFYLSPHPTYGLFDKSISNVGVYNDQTNELLMKLRRHNNAVNVYVVNEPVPPNSVSPPGTVTLAYYNPSADWIVTRKSETNGNEPNVTLPHEMGHLFSLPHTFYGYEPNPFDASDATWPIAPANAPLGGGVTTERQNGTNCASSSDHICDTPPDYNFGLIWNNNCTTYNGGAKDPTGVIVVPEQNNFMSYFNGCTNYHFSQDQIDLMLADREDPTRNYLDNSFVPAATNIDTPSDLLVSPGNGDTVDYYNNVLLQWNSVAGATHYLVEVDINSSFSTNYGQTFIETGNSKLLTNLSPSKTYYYRVKPFNVLVGCATPRTILFRTSNKTLSTSEIEGLTAWQVSPNPVNAEMARLNLVSEKAFEATVRISDAAGRTVRVENGVQIPEGEFSYELSVDGLSNGLYFVSLESGNGRNVRKMSVLR